MKYTFNSNEENCFKTISDFKEGIIRGGEPVFAWKGLEYGVCFYGDKYCIALTSGAQEKICDTPDDVLNYQVGEDRLRDIITQATVLHRNIGDKAPCLLLANHGFYLRLSTPITIVFGWKPSIRLGFFPSLA